MALHGAEFDPAEMATITDALHNLPGFVAPEAAAGFDHQRFLDVEAEMMLTTDRTDGGALQVLAEQWRRILVQHYGQATVDLMFPANAAAAPSQGCLWPGERPGGR